MPAAVRSGFALSPRREMALCCPVGIRNLGSNIEWMKRARTEWGKAVQRCVKQLGSWKYGGVGGVPRGRWVLLGWHGGFDPVQFAAIAEILGHSPKCVSPRRTKPEALKLSICDEQVAKGRIRRRSISLRLSWCANEHSSRLFYTIARSVVSLF